MNTCASCGAPLPDAARFCPACAAPVEAKPDQRERKLATIVFADLVGSTELGASQDPERTRALLDRFYDAMAAEIDNAGGTVEKFAGDAVMAVFGAPFSLEDHAERALHSALAMQRRLQELFADRLALRIGVNTGGSSLGSRVRGVRSSPAIRSTWRRDWSRPLGLGRSSWASERSGQPEARSSSGSGTPSRPKGSRRA